MTFFKSKTLSLVAAALLLAGCHSSTPPKPAAAPLTEEQRQSNVASFDYVWTTVRDKHYDPTLHGLDWNAVRDELRPKVAMASTKDEARGYMTAALERLNESHFGIIPSDVYANMDSAAAEAKATPATSPSTLAATMPTSAPAPVTSAKPKDVHGSSGLRLHVINGQAVVTAIDAGSAAEKASIKRGWILVESKGRRAADVVKSVQKQFGASPQFELYAGAALGRLASGKLGQTVDMVFLDGNDKKVKATLTLLEPQGSRSSFGNMPEQRVFLDVKRLDSNVAYVSLNMFFDPVNVMPKFAEAVTSNMDADGMILDLRGNPGGLGAMSMGMGNWFISDQYLGTMITRGTQMKFALTKRAVQFNKPLAILVDGGSASTSEILAGGLQDLGRARVFGTRSAGAALPSNIERLPNGDGFQYAFADYVSRNGRHLEGAGVMPDEKVVLDRKSLLAGNDAVVDAAVKWIKSSKTN